MKKRLFSKIAMISLALFASTCSVMADEAADEVITITYPYVSDNQDLKDYIDSDGEYASSDFLKTKKYSTEYGFTVDEPGTMIFCPLDSDGLSGERNSLYIYSNKSMTSQIYQMKFLDNALDLSQYGEVYLTPGTYYYNYRDLDEYVLHEGNTLAVFMAFIPDDQTSLDDANAGETMASSGNVDLEEESRKLREEIEYLTQIIEQAGIDLETIAD